MSAVTEALKKELQRLEGVIADTEASLKHVELQRAGLRNRLEESTAAKTELEAAIPE